MSILLGNIKGPQGNPGISTYWFTGTAVTGTGSSISATVANSKAHDMYLNTDNANVYEATAANTWDYKCNIQGIQGETETGLLVGSLSLPTSGYSGSGPYTKTFTVTGASTDTGKRYLLIPDWSSTAATRALEKTAWNLIDDYEITAADTLTVTVTAVPATAVSFSLKEVV